MHNSQFQIPFCGRPNAGKSSLISVLSGKKVSIGRAPGTTRSISIIPIYRNISFLDMPGFGKTKHSRRFTELTKTKLVRYLEVNSSKFLCSVLVIDITTFPLVCVNLERKGIIPLDIEFARFLLELTNSDEIPGNVIVAINKIDRLDSREQKRNLAIVSEKLPSNVHIFPISCKTKKGIREIRNRLKDMTTGKLGPRYQGFLTY